jgi:hypothetical protein
MMPGTEHTRPAPQPSGTLNASERGKSADAKRLLDQRPLSVAPRGQLARVRAALETARAKLARIEARTTESNDDNDGGIFS